MSFYRTFLWPALRYLPPEVAHRLAIEALQSGLIPSLGTAMHAPVLRTECCGLTFHNPIGVAPGFDKDAAVADILLGMGFGLVECGTITPLPQAGNPKPRLFRLEEDEAVINRLGFNNHGLQAALRNLRWQERRLAKLRAQGSVLGLNIGKNKDSEDAKTDYLRMLTGVYANADYITVNISSPNTPGLRDLQAKDALRGLLEPLLEQRAKLVESSGRKVPLWLKVAPDLEAQERCDVAELALELELDALVVGNTTLSRLTTLKSPLKAEQGGLSGKPLMALSTEVLADFYRLTGGKIPLVGVGGIASAADAYAKIRAGATLVQLYSAFVYQGFGLAADIAKGMAELLAKDGFANVRDAVGVDQRRGT